MRIGIIKLDKLVIVRRSFRLWWRLVASVLFFSFVYIWWLGFMFPDRASTGEFPIPGVNGGIATWVFPAILMLILGIAFFRKDQFARLFFAGASGFAAVNIVVFVPIFMYSKLLEGANKALVFGVVAVFLVVTWKYLIRYSYVLWLSLIPCGPGKAYRAQVVYSLHVQEVAKLNHKKHHKPGTINAASSNTSLLYLLTVGGLTFIAGLSAMLVALLAFANENLAWAIYRQDYSKAASIIENYSLNPSTPEWGDFWPVLLGIFMPALFGYVNLMVFGSLWHRWQRSAIPVLEASSSLRISPSSVLLLRHSKDDIMRIPKRNWTLARLPFIIYDWNFTFEEVIAKQLAFIGPLYCLGSAKDKAPLFHEPLDRLHVRTGKYFGMPPRWLSLGIRKVRERLPKKLPPRGGIRYHLDDSEWEEFVINNMLEARVLVIIMGSVKDDQLQSEALQKEMDWVKADGHLEKAIFLMPPLIGAKEMRARWDGFLDYLLDRNGYQETLLEVKAEEVLGVCFHKGEPVIITGAERSEFFYESALDVAGTFASGASDRTGEMIVKYVNVMKTRAANALM